MKGQCKGSSEKSLYQKLMNINIGTKDLCINSLRGTIYPFCVVWRIFVCHQRKG